MESGASDLMNSAATHTAHRPHVQVGQKKEFGTLGPMLQFVVHRGYCRFNGCVPLREWAQCSAVRTQPLAHHRTAWQKRCWCQNSDFILCHPSEGLAEDPPPPSPPTPGTCGAQCWVQWGVGGQGGLGGVYWLWIAGSKHTFWTLFLLLYCYMVQWDAKTPGRKLPLQHHGLLSAWGGGGGGI